MFDGFSQRLTSIFNQLRGKGILTEESVDAALREVRIALLEADVALPVVREFTAKVRERAVGQAVLKSIQPVQMAVKIVHDCLVETLGMPGDPLIAFAAPPFSVLMTGLQGAGKTTNTVKLAQFLQDTYRKKVLTVSLDVYRPAAQEQLRIIAQQAGIACLPIIEGEKPAEIINRGMLSARREGYDAIIWDTAGRLHIDDAMMREIREVSALTSPVETLLVADAMTGQDAVTIAKTFHEQVDLTGIILTRVDGDGRGGAALSMRSITGCPVKFLSTGEKTENFEVFDPVRIADRILDMGDIVSFVEKAAKAVSAEETAALAAKMQEGKFSLDDMAKQLDQMQRMGGIGSLIGMLPGIGRVKDQLGDLKDKDLLVRRQIAIIRAMTPAERANYRLLNAKRKIRVAKGSGVDVSAVNKLLKQYEQMQALMKTFKKQSFLQKLSKFT